MRACRSRWKLIPLLVFFCVLENGAVAVRANVTVAEGNSSNATSAPHHASVRVARFDFERVRTPYTFAFALLVSAIAKLVFHSWEKLSSKTPESCLLIVLGLVVGAIIRATSSDVITFTPQLFFFYLLPPIMLDAGYRMKRRAFFDNLSTILLYAVMGTVWNVFAMALGLYAMRLLNLIRITTTFAFPECLLFGAISAAVDPVAVLAVFDEAHVNVSLFILVFGESILNDAVSVVLYQSAETFVELPTVTAPDVLLAFVSFFTVSFGGLLIGIIFGLFASFVTRFTENVQVLEVLLALLCGYLSFLSAEIFHFSGILSAIGCGQVMRHYLHENVSLNSQITIKYFMKMSSAASETIIFVFLGLEAVSGEYVWDTGLVVGTLVFAVIFRFVGVFALTYLANRYRIFPISLTEQIIMGYGGLRGAVSFSLVLLLDESNVPSKHAMFTAAFCLIIFTVFVQGVTIKPLVSYLRVARDDSLRPTVNQLIHAKTIDHLTAGIEEIIGQIGDQRLYELIAHYDMKYLTPFFIKNDAEGAETLISQIERTCMEQAKTVHLRGLYQSKEHITPLQSCSIPEEDEAGPPLLHADMNAATTGILRSPMTRSKHTSDVPQSLTTSDDFIKQLFAPSTKSSLIEMGTLNRNVIQSSDKEMEQRLRMVQWNQAMHSALAQAHMSHHNHHSKPHQRSMMRSRQLRSVSRQQSFEATSSFSSMRSANNDTPIVSAGISDRSKRRVLSEGDAISIKGSVDGMSIRTMSDPSIHFDLADAPDDAWIGTRSIIKPSISESDVRSI